MAEHGAPDIRASDDDRERTLALLREHHLSGRLTVDELSERVERVYRARTLGDVHELTRDLPAAEARPRADALADAIAEHITEGWHVEWQSGDQAVLVRGQRPNHLLHGLLTVFTGLWGVVWLAVALSSARQRVLVRVDEAGNVEVKRAR